MNVVQLLSQLCYFYRERLNNFIFGSGVYKLKSTITIFDIFEAIFIV